MSNTADTLKNIFSQLNLTEESVKVYIFVLQNTYASPLEISRKLKIPRTKVYRCLKKLVELKLIRQVVGEKGAIRFCSERPENVLNLVHAKERELLLLKSEITGLVNQLNLLSQNASKDFEIVTTNIFQNYIQKLRNQDIILISVNEYGENLIRSLHKSKVLSLVNNFKKEIIQNAINKADKAKTDNTSILIVEDTVFMINEFEVLKIKNALIRELLINRFRTNL